MKLTNLVALLSVAVLPLTSGNAQVPVAPGPDGAAPPPVAAAPTDFSAAASEVVRLAEAGTTDDVLQGYIQNANSPFSLTADQILYLHDIGVSQSTITAMLNRDNALRNQPQTYTYNQTAYPPTAQPPAPIQPTAAPSIAPAPTVPNAPTIDAAPPPAPAAQPAPVYVSTPPPDVAYFYNSLSPYGTWVTLDGIGWCWQPRVVVINRGWRPYSDGGHWVYSDCGWFWQSDYSWGWAPFHYGRWQFQDRCGWVWVPDRVWGPSWVVWRSEGNNCGWAPLPPHAVFDVHLGWSFNGVRVGVNFDFGLHPDYFTFVAMNNFSRHDFAQCRLQPAEVTRIYNHTTIINNYVVNKTTIVNRGIEVDRVRTATHAPMRQVAVRDVPAGSPQLRGGRPGGAETAVYRPQLQAPARPVKMVAQQVDDRHPVIQHAPVASLNTAHRGAPVPNSTAPAAPPRAYNTQPVPPTPHSQAYSAPRESQPVLAAPKAMSQPKPVARNETPHATPSAGRPQAGTSWQAPENQVARPPQVAKPDEPGRLYPLQTGPTAHQQPASTAAQGQVYQPKGYYQHAETHVLPPLPKAQEPTPAREPQTSSREPQNAAREPQNSHGEKPPQSREPQNSQGEKAPKSKD